MMRYRPAGLFLILASVVSGHAALAQDSAKADCTGGASGVRIAKPSGQESDDIQFAIRKAGPGSTVLLSGDYDVDSTIELQDGVTLCSTKGATLKWTAPQRAGMMISAVHAKGTTIQNLVLDGRGILLKGAGHTVEGNLIRNITGGSESKKRWGERHGILVVDKGEGITIRNNLLRNIVDTGIMAYGLEQSTVSDNVFQGVSEGIHLWSAKDTVVRKNSGQGFKAMSIEIQGDHRPGLVIEYNSFKNWHKDHEKGAYAMSVVSGESAIIRHNTIEGSPLMAAGLEIGGRAPRVLSNTLIDANIIITDAPDTLVKDNVLTRAGIVKDVNRASHGTLTIQDNIIQNAPRVAIFSDHWWGYDQVTITGNRITKQITSGDAPDFVGILATDFNKQPLIITHNHISMGVPERGGRAIRAVCIANAGYKGNMRGTLIAGNTCDGGGVGVFADSNSLGGHVGIIYRDNKLHNLRDTIQGDSEGMVATGNQFNNVQADQARLKDR